jgi:hypothetical protein
MTTYTPCHCATLQVLRGLGTPALQPATQLDGHACTHAQLLCSAAATLCTPPLPETHSSAPHVQRAPPCRRQYDTCHHINKRCCTLHALGTGPAAHTLLQQQGEGEPAHLARGLLCIAATLKQGTANACEFKSNPWYTPQLPAACERPSRPGAVPRAPPGSHSTTHTTDEVAAALTHSCQLPGGLGHPQGQWHPSTGPAAAAAAGAGAHGEGFLALALCTHTDCTDSALGCCCTPGSHTTHTQTPGKTDSICWPMDRSHKGNRGHPGQPPI